MKSLNLKKRICLLLFFTGLIIGGSLIPSRFSVTLTDSLNHRVFFIRHVSAQETFRKYDYVVFPITSRFINNGKTVKAMKQIACNAGETLKVEGKNYYCENRFLGAAKEYSLKGEKVENFTYSGRIPPDMFFVLGESKDSFDSRYYGLINRADVQAIAYPIF